MRIARSSPRFCPLWPDRRQRRDSVEPAAAAQRCKAWHSIGVRGASPNPAAPPFRTLSQRYPLEDLQESLAEGIVVGHAQGMPRVRMAPRQVADFLRYLQSIQQK